MRKLFLPASPKTRPAVRTMPVTMPGMATGSTAWRMVCHFVDPSARLAARSSAGTARIACSDRRRRSGRLNTMSVRAPPSAVNPQPVVATKSANPNRPTTIDGTELISSWENRIAFVSRPSPAYSAM
jgi:hypothetical protein